MTGTPRETLEAALGERYAIERELARGGMATIYLARDANRGEQVAVKLMDPKLARAVGVERFLREIEIVRSVTHPLIVPLYESGTAGELLYYVMPYIAGESLYQRLERDRRLSLEDALQIVHDVAAALGFAHGRGILHRDVKPENILVANGRALVADFGLARAIGSADYQKLTETGVIVGTVFYMSPEQLREDRDLDQRTDIYSLGCILYEMLTGEPPFTGPSLREVISRILRGPIPSARQLRPEVPAAVEQAVSRAIAKSAAERFSTMQEFAAALPPPRVDPATGSGPP
ncbi:MAG: serine/threonine protein kinase [Gemmatimonadales bacterium]|nr:MAG: serine/threonine protein kinase [Gemmatimonadales bacterium]